MSLTINEFWKPRFVSVKTSPCDTLKGWHGLTESMNAFREAPLNINEELSNCSAISASLILISAPGAVGKSTLAKQIAAETGAVLVDLAEADPVGGNTISGGLAKSGLYAVWQSGTVALLIDGLDEARLRVTQESFESFLTDVADLATQSRIPIILFGRTGSIQDSWLLLSERPLDLAVLEIGFYGAEAALAFAKARLFEKSLNKAHFQVQEKAVELLLEGLRKETGADGDRFAGYAPVLQAVADRVALEENVAALVAQIEKGERPVTLRSVVLKIMEREQAKLSSVALKDQTLLGKLYQSEEQMDRLVAQVYNLPAPALPEMLPEDAQAYAAALETWLPEHPFLEGAGRPSSAVFDAVIAASALKSSTASKLAANVELGKGAAANPFLSEFYLPDGEEASDPVYIPVEHIGILYSAFRATLSIGDRASLQIEGNDDGQDEEALKAEVEIAVGRNGVEQPRLLKFATEQVGTLRLGSHVEDVDIYANYSDVEIGVGHEVLLVAPIIIKCSGLVLNADKMIVEVSRSGNENFVSLECTQFDGSRMLALPNLRGEVSLAVNWPDAKIHPWTSYVVAQQTAEDPRIDEGLRRFRKFITAFRSHSKGQLARYRDKLDHERMTKGPGSAILNKLKDDKIIYVVGSMYYLDADKLGELTGANYFDIAGQHFAPSTVEYIKGAIAH